MQGYLLMTQQGVLAEAPPSPKSNAADDPTTVEKTIKTNAAQIGQTMPFIKEMVALNSKDGKVVDFEGDTSDFIKVFNPTNDWVYM